MPTVRPVKSLKRYRAMFDLKPDADKSLVDLRMYVADEYGYALSKISLYRWGVTR